MNQEEFRHFQKLDPVNRKRYVAYLHRKKIYDLGFEALARRVGMMDWLQKYWPND